MARGPRLPQALPEPHRWCLVHRALHSILIWRRHPALPLVYRDCSARTIYSRTLVFVDVGRCLYAPCVVPFAYSVPNLLYGAAGVPAVAASMGENAERVPIPASLE